MMHPILRRMAAKVDLHDGRGHQRWDWPMVSFFSNSHDVNSLLKALVANWGVC